MSSGGGDVSVVVKLESEGSGVPCPSGGRGTSSSTSGSGNAQKPTGFRSVSSQNAESATQAAIQKRLNRLPGATAFSEAARFSAEAGARGRQALAGIGDKWRGVGSAMSAAAIHGQNPFGIAGGAIAASAGAVAGPALLATAGSLAVAFGGLLLTVRGVQAAYQLQQRAMQALLGTYQNTGVLQALQRQQSTRLRFDREVRAMERMPDLSGLLARQTDRQMTFDRAIENISLEIATVLEPIVGAVAGLAAWTETIDFSKWTATFDAIATIVGGPWLVGQIKKTVALLQEAHNVSVAFRRRSQSDYNRKFREALDPMALHNQPFAAGHELAGTFNPRDRK